MTSQTAPRWMPRVRIEHLWLSLPVALVVWFGFVNPLRLFDFWWHLKAGEIIVSGRSVPQNDLFSFTAAGKPFLLQSWLAEVLYYAVYRMGGLPSLIVMNTALLVVTLVPVYALCLQAAGRLRLGVIATFPAAFGLVYFGHIRTQVFSFLLFAIFYWILSTYRRRERDLLWALAPLMILWVNLHGAFVLGLGLMLLFCGCEVALRLIRGAQPDTLSPTELRKLAAWCGLTALATLANPHTYRLYSAVVAVMTDPASQSFVVEWQAPRVDRLGLLIFYGPFLVTLCVLLYAKQRPGLTESCLFVGFAVFALSALRNAIWFVLVACPLLACYLPMLDWQTFFEPLRRFRRIDAFATWVKHRAEAGATAPIRHGLNTLLIGLMFASSATVSPWLRPHLGSKRLGAALWDPKTPVGAMDYIGQHHLQGNIFHPQAYGDYLIWRLWPDQRSFFDSRVHLFGKPLVEDYLLVFYDSHWEERLAPYGIRYLLLAKDDEGERMMIDAAWASPHWRKLYEDEVSVLFEHLP